MTVSSRVRLRGSEVAEQMFVNHETMRSPSSTPGCDSARRRVAERLPNKRLRTDQRNGLFDFRILTAE